MRTLPCFIFSLAESFGILQDYPLGDEVCNFIPGLDAEAMNNLNIVRNTDIIGMINQIKAADVINLDEVKDEIFENLLQIDGLKEYILGKILKNLM